MNRKKSKQQDVREDALHVFSLSSSVLANAQVSLGLGSRIHFGLPTVEITRIMLPVKALEKKKKMKGTLKIDFNSLGKRVKNSKMNFAFILNCRN